MQQFNPNSDTSRARLKKAREASWKLLGPFRDFRYDAYREFVGKHYGADGPTTITPLNNLLMVVQIYTQNLIAQCPAAGVTTQYPTLRPYADMFKAALNQTIKEINLQHALEQCIVETLFGAGIMKVGLTMTSDNAEGFLHDAATPFADPILLEDWVHDMGARSFEEVSFCGNKYRIPLIELQENPIYDSKVSDKLSTDSPNQVSGLDGGTGESTSRLSTGSKGMNTDNDLYDQVEVWDTWLPREGLLITEAANQDLPPLRVVEWDGPERGPYHMNPYQIVPGNVMPLAPMCGIYDMHVLINQLMRKAGRQSERQRTVLAYEPGASSDAQRLQDVDDGNAVKVANINAVKEFRLGGADAANVSWMTQVRQLFSYHSGNLDTMGGLGSMTDTVGQDQLLAQNSSQRLQDMQRRTQKFTGSVMEDVGYYLWNSDAVKHLQLRIEGTEINVPTYWGGDQRVGQFYQYNVDIVPFSMLTKTPEEIVNAILQTVGQVAMPLMSLLQAQGYTIDVKSLIGKIAEYRRIPELLEVIRPADPSQAAEVDDSMQPNMPDREPVTRSKGHVQQTQMDAAMKQMASDQRSNSAAGG